MHITWHNFRFWKRIPTRKTEKVLTNAGLCVQRTVRPNKRNFGVWSRESFIAGPHKENRPPKSRTPRRVSAKHF